MLGQLAPSRQIAIGAIGVGRTSRGHDLPALFPLDAARAVVVCDLDDTRVELGKQLVNQKYTAQFGKPYNGVVGYRSYHDLLARPDIDAVVISTPDHQYAIIAAAAV